MFQNAPEISGLSSEEVAQQLVSGNTGHLPLRSNRTYWEILKANAFSSYNLILVVSSVAVLMLRGSRDVLFALLLVVTNIGLGLFQEIRAKKILDKLAVLQTHRIHVRRAGEMIEIPLDQLVLNDVIVIFPGEPIVADGELLFSDSLELDESSLTGESESVPKKVGDRLTSGAFGLAGFGLMKAEKIGKKSSLYELTEKAKGFRASQTDSEKWLKKLFQILLYTILVLAPLTFISGINQHLSVQQTLVNVVNLVSSLIPQGLIIGMTILFAYGVVSISKYKTLVQRVNVIAIMGTITVLCADKTGTLTTNELSLEKIVPLGETPLAKIKAALRDYTKHVSWANKTLQAVADFLIVDAKKTDAAEVSSPANQLVKTVEVPFTSARKWGGLSFADRSLVIGAPEILTTDHEILAQVAKLNKDGFRVLAMAESNQELKVGEELPTKLELIALLPFRDHLRTEVKETLAALANQHIHFKIITGDSSETLRTIVSQLQLPNGTFYEQTDLENATSGSFSQLVKQGQFFARITPAMKEKIVAELVSQGEIVAMVGDGVNDVRAMKEAHVAISVNAASQVTKDVADLILLDNSFASLPKAIEEGRDITQRVYAIAKIFFVKVIYLITLFLLAGFGSFGFPISLRETTWLGFIVVGIPTALITFKILKPRPTLNIQKDLIQYTLTSGVIGGLVMALIMIMTQLVFKDDLQTSRTQVSLFAALFSTFILFQVTGISIFHFASIKKNLVSFFIILTIGVIAVLFPAGITPGIFQSARLESIDWLVLAFAIGGSVLVLRFLLKRVGTLFEFKM